MVTAVMRTRAVSGMAEPEGAGVIPIGLLVNHDGLGLRLRLHEHPPKSEREGNDRND